jgi:putative ABC transport system permease protein
MGSVFVVGMRESSVGHGAALSELQELVGRLRGPGNIRKAPVLRPFLSTLTDYEKTPLLTLLAACFLLLVIGCVNTANLLITRGTARRKEIVLRVILGASRGRVLAQVLTEGLTVSVVGAGVGLVLAFAVVSYVRHAYAERFPRFDEIAIHLTVFGVCAALAVIAGLLAALGPAVHALKNPSEVQGKVGGSRRPHLVNTLVAAELALTFLLLTVGGLLLRTFRALEQVPLGFQPQNLTLLTLMPTNPNQSAQISAATYSDLLEALVSLPGVVAATTETSVPFSDFSLRLNTNFAISGRPEKTSDTVDVSLISPGYLRTLDIRLAQGRELREGDGPGSPIECLVNQAFVRRFLERSPSVVGTALRFTGSSPGDRLLPDPITIVGVIPDIFSNQELGEVTAPKLLLNYRQFPPDANMANFFFNIAPQLRCDQIFLRHRLRMNYEPY